MEFNINISNKTAYTILVIFLILSVGVIVYAYGTNNPSSIGHSAGEVMVSISGMNKTIQQAIDDGDFSGGGAGECTLLGETDPNAGTTWVIIDVPAKCIDSYCVLKAEAILATTNTYYGSRLIVYSQDSSTNRISVDHTSAAYTNGDSIYSILVSPYGGLYTYDDHPSGETSPNQWSLLPAASWISRLYVC